MPLNPEIQLIRPFSYPHLIDEETEIQGVQQLAQHHTAWEDQTGILIQAVWLNRIFTHLYFTHSSKVVKIFTHSKGIANQNKH